MSAAAVEWTVKADPAVVPETSLSEAAEWLTRAFGEELRAMGPVWLRVDLTQRLWLGTPVSVMAVAAPSSVLRLAVALLVAVGVTVQLRWSALLAAHQQRSQEFVDQLALEVAGELETELRSAQVEQRGASRIRPGLRIQILDVAGIHADVLRRSNQRKALR